MKEPGNRLDWLVSSRCDSGNCIEVATTEHRVLVRASDRPEAVLILSWESWRAFMSGVGAGDFDQPSSR